MRSNRTNPYGKLPLSEDSDSDRYSESERDRLAPAFLIPKLIRIINMIKLLQEKNNFVTNDAVEIDIFRNWEQNVLSV